MMNDHSIWSRILPMLTTQIPAYLAYVVGMAVALGWMPRCPRPASLVFAACALSLLASLAFVGIQAYLIMRMETSNSGSLATAFSILGLTHVIVHVVSLTLLVAAAFVDRTPRATPRA
jgi:hypothetical protein